ncbi:MAG: dihydroneopterin aldolase [Solirubrobacteraceae bacterium]
MGKILVENIRIYAFHGCLEEESIIGTDYLITLEVDFNSLKSVLSDNLEDTVDYVVLNRIVKEEMKVRSKLIEHVAGRIINRIINEVELIKEVKIKLSKISPPIGGDVQKVTFEYQKKVS